MEFIPSLSKHGPGLEGALSSLRMKVMIDCASPVFWRSRNGSSAPGSWEREGQGSQPIRRLILLIQCNMRPPKRKLAIRKGTERLFPPTRDVLLS